VGSKEEETQRLLTPSLNDVRTYQIGKFLDYSLSVSGGKKSKTLFGLKSVVHPQWFEHRHTTQQMDLYLSEKALAFLLSEGKVSGRWTRKRKWRKKENQESGKGEWYYKYRTPKSTTWIAASQRSSGQKGKAGRKPAGDAYRVRRDVWRILSSNKGFLPKLLEDSLHHSKERKPVKKFPVRLPNLSIAIEEIIIDEIWPELIYNREKLVNGWLNLRGVRSYLLKHGFDSEVCNQFSKGVLAERERNHIIHLICKKHWRKLLAQWVELGIFSRHLSYDGFNLNDLSDMHNYQLQRKEEKDHKPETSCFFDCDCLPKGDEPNLQVDVHRCILVCDNCNIVAGKIFSYVDPVSFEERLIFSTSDLYRTN